MKHIKKLLKRKVETMLWFSTHIKTVWIEICGWWPVALKPRVAVLCYVTSKITRHSIKWRNISRHLIGWTSTTGCEHSYLKHVCHTILGHICSKGPCINSDCCPSIRVAVTRTTTYTMPTHFIFLPNKTRVSFKCHPHIQHTNQSSVLDHATDESNL